MSHQSKKLYRSGANRIIFGVCAGLATYFKLDPVLIRLIFIVLGLFNGVGILLYLILFVAVPKEPGEYVGVDRKDKVKEFVKEVEQKAEHLVDEVRQETKSVKDEFKKKQS